MLLLTFCKGGLAVAGRFVGLSIALRLVGIIGFVGLLGGCLEPAPLSPAARVGALAFVDPSLSVSGKVSCATCHAAATGHSSAHARGFELGGPNGSTPGLRNSQTLRYLASNTAFFMDDEGTPTGGFFLGWPCQ